MENLMLAGKRGKPSNVLFYSSQTLEIRPKSCISFQQSSTDSIPL